MVDIVLLTADMDMLLSSTNHGTMGTHMNNTNFALRSLDLIKRFSVKPGK